MADFLSDEWIAALHAAASADAGLCELSRSIDLVIEQEVVDGPDGTRSYQVALQGGTVSVAASGTDEPTVRFSQDYATAAGIALGEDSAQRAFMTGRLRVGGDLRVLLEHTELLSQLDDVFADVRAETTLRPGATVGTDA